MGTLTAQSIINKAVIQLNDISAVRWTRAELLSWLNDGQRQITVAQPAASSYVTSVLLTTGTLQSIPADGWMLLDVYRNMGANGTTPGRAIRIISKEMLDGFNPDWHSDYPSAVSTNFIFDIQNQTGFWVYPPSDGTGYVQINYSRLPAALTAETQTIGLSDAFQTTLLDYLMYRACSKDAEYAPGLQLAAAYWQAFTTALGAKNAAEIKSSKNRSLGNERGSPDPGAES